MAGLLDLIAARNPQQAGGLLSDMVAPVRNRLSDLVHAGLLDAARQYARDAAPGGSLNAEWTPENVRTAGEVASMMPNPAGDVISGLLAVDDLRKGNYGDAALNSLGLVPFVPALGGAIKQTGNLGKSLSLPDEIASARRLPVFGTLPESSAWDVAGNVYANMAAKIRALKNGDYVVEAAPAWGAKNKPFFAVGDNPSELAQYAVDRLSRSDKSIAAANKAKFDKSVLGKLKKEFGDNFDLGRSTQSKSEYITHTPSGTKIRISDHNLPLHYEQPDVDLRTWMSDEEKIAAIRKALGE